MCMYACACACDLRATDAYFATKMCVSVCIGRSVCVCLPLGVRVHVPMPMPMRVRVRVCVCDCGRKISQLNSGARRRPAEHFKYIQRGANVGVAHRPATSLQNTLVALQAIGINDAERDEIFRVLSAILHLGNVNFGSDKDGGASLAAVDPVATTVARMLGCDASKLVDSVCVCVCVCVCIVHIFTHVCTRS